MTERTRSGADGGGVFVASGGISATRQLLAASDLGPAGTLAFVLALGFLAGFVLKSSRSRSS